MSASAGIVSGSRAPCNSAHSWRSAAETISSTAVLFFVALLPQFVDADGPLPLQIGLLGIVDVAIGLVVWAVVTTAVGRLAGISSNSTSWNRVAGVLFIGIGVALAVEAV
ncbi:hypothetical protein HQO84_00010 [Rhodococcus fascians]|nr:hypothetical protein [Rhodococcus fascians]MBY3999075.1 hypothetical protein [Rhodococcus fascians]MBY4000151.1 hypothetical protein [Rhodococcus fascians]MBY4005179.1 hypothetical protein [Rhodococcus fascians]MBY4016829.1 hypothetical protein [Rhodococcus fascians]